MKGTREIDLAAEFQRRRSHWLSMMRAWGALFLVGIAIRIAFPTLTRWAMVLMGFGAIGWLVVRVFAKPRCPRCEKIPDVSSDGEGTLRNPEACPACSLQFR